MTEDRHMKSMHCKAPTLEAGMDIKVMKPGIKKKRKPTPSQEPPTARLTGAFIFLEPRILFDGAKLVTGAEVVQASITKKQPGILDTEREASTDSTHTGFSYLDALWLSCLSHSLPPDRKKVDGINPAAEVIHLDSTRDGNFVPILDLEIKVDLLKTQGIIIRAGFQKWQRLLTETTCIVNESASLDMGDQAHEIHSTKPWSQTFSYDSPGSIYMVDRIGLVPNPTDFPLSS
ncbi:MAG: hypothetical protein NPIRA05_05770 [Nitrospirales bacterium]|nr:MAG: hypothetical protein NPIRA05_05770 [Nitrospirales bacterium]